MQLVRNGITVTVPDREVERLVLDRLVGAAAVEPVRSVFSPPPIGEYWYGQGGIYAGLCRSRGNGPDYHLIAGPEHEADINWNDATAWALTIDIEDHRDFALPARREQPILFGNAPELFKARYYWSSEQHAELSVYAWGQDFDNGFQDYWFKVTKNRARLVRRLTI